MRKKHLVGILKQYISFFVTEYAYLKFDSDQINPLLAILVENGHYHITW